ncbi:MAG: OstA-like protein [Bacteroidales bacterium]
MKRLIIFIILIVNFFNVFAQPKNDKDSLVRLVSAESAQLKTIKGISYRLIKGHTRFLHNNTYLLCDSARWNTDAGYIDALGHVQIIQENTKLVGDSIHYIINEDLAQFRGSTVELRDDKNNILCTKYLDYNTKDSLAIFHGGGCMKDKDGNLIESNKGIYDSKNSIFTFIHEVEMFSDSIFFATDTLDYYSKINKAYYRGHTKGWKSKNTISSNSGFYDRKNKVIYFQDDVHAITPEYEMWGDKFYYYRKNVHAELYGNVELRDTVNKLIVLGEELIYNKDPMRLEIPKDPYIVSYEKTKKGNDTTFVIADQLYYKKLHISEIDSLEVSTANKRWKEAIIDPYRNAIDKMKKDAANDNGDNSSEPRGNPKGGISGDIGGLGSDRSGGHTEIPDSTSEIDYIAPREFIDVNQNPKDSVPENKGFLKMYNHVKIYRKDMQMLCDSLVYTDLDSIARLYKDPIVWHEKKTQMTSDSMQLLIQNKALNKGLMLSNAYVVSFLKDSIYHQIKSPEMAAYFNNNTISRFDALGGVQALFFLDDKGVVANMNKKECRLMSARLSKGKLQKVYYLQDLKSTIYPVPTLKLQDMRLKDFVWRGNERPVNPKDLSTKKLRSSKRNYILNSPSFPNFIFSAIYFDDYMENILKDINNREGFIWKKKDSKNRLSFEKDDSYLDEFKSRDNRMDYKINDRVYKKSVLKVNVPKNKKRVLDDKNKSTLKNRESINHVINVNSQVMNNRIIKKINSVKDSNSVADTIIKR